MTYVSKSYAVFAPKSDFSNIVVYIFESIWKKSETPPFISFLLKRNGNESSIEEKELLLHKIPHPLWEMKCTILSSFSNYATVGWSAVHVDTFIGDS